MSRGSPIRSLVSVEKKWGLHIGRMTLTEKHFRDTELAFLLKAQSRTLREKPKVLIVILSSTFSTVYPSNFGSTLLSTHL